MNQFSNDIGKHFRLTRPLHRACIAARTQCVHSRSALLLVTLHRASHLALDLCARGCTRFPRERAAFTAVDDDGRGLDRGGVFAERQEEEWRGTKGGGGVRAGGRRWQGE